LTQHGFTDVDKAIVFTSSKELPNACPFTINFSEMSSTEGPLVGPAFKWRLQTTGAFTISTDLSKLSQASQTYNWTIAFSSALHASVDLSKQVTCTPPMPNLDMHVYTNTIRFATKPNEGEINNEVRKTNIFSFLSFLLRFFL